MHPSGFAARRSAPLAAFALALLGACRPQAPAAAEVQLASDLPAATLEQALKLAAAQGAPRGERIAGLALGAADLPAAAGGDAGSMGTRTVAVPTIATPTSSAAGLDAGAAAGRGGDLRWDLEPYGAMAAASRGELLPAPSSGDDVPELWRDPDGNWVAIGGRAQVLLVGLDALGQQPVPSRFTALTEAPFKGKVALAAPTRGPALAHFAALYSAWGEARMRAWLAGLQANGVQVLESDDEVRAAVVAGRAIVGILGSDAAAQAAASAARVEVVSPNQRSIGTFVWPTALSRPRDAAHPDAAQALAMRLADRSIEQLLVAREPGFLPLRPGIPTPPGVRSASNLVVISVSPAAIAAEIGRRQAELAAWVAAARAGR